MLDTFQGHCLIVPMHHVSCGTLVDEDVYSEIQEFRRALTTMFGSGKRRQMDEGSESSDDDDEGSAKDCVFFETALRLKKQPHMVVQCVPLPQRVGNEAPMYFQVRMQYLYSVYSVQFTFNCQFF